MVELILEPLAYGFVLRGLVAGLLAAVACAVLSAFVVWRGMAFIGDALAHAILPGIVVAYIFGFSLFLGALGAGALAVVGIGTLAGRDKLKEDTAIGIVFSGFFALGILLMSRVTSYQDLSHVLFGNILGVALQDLYGMALVVVLVLLVVLASYKELLVTSFDPAHAVAIGLYPAIIRYVLLLLLALTTVVAIQTVGVILVLALLVTPGAAASMISRRLHVIIGLATVIAVVSTIAGFYASYYGDVSSGPAIALTATVIFGVSYVVSRVRILRR